MAGMNITPFVFLLMAVITLSGFSPASSQSWRWFQRKHMDNSVLVGDNNYCNNIIRDRRITNRGQCKFRNTFIHALPSTIKGLCMGQEGYVSSNNPYALTDCFHAPVTNNEMPPNCNYRFQDRSRQIKIKCENSDPVHFERALNN
ncbi:ribonuclease pancreatic-like [Ambystoma mexicanum]|uniref:ribonuclease pancreatic-like n=1 Tax=Ambystoma mexicanum TaxID=8296 RepID=UPI0037E9C4EF